MEKHIFKTILICSIATVFFACNNETKTIENKENTTSNVVKTQETEIIPLTAAAEGKVRHIGKAQFLATINDFEKSKDWNLKSDLPCVIDFYADWCKPCKMIAPFMEELALEYKDKVHFLKVNVDNEEDLAKQFNINGIPAILYCPKTGKPEMRVGGMPKAEIKNTIEKVIFGKK